MPVFQNNNLLKVAKKVIKIEADAICNLNKKIDHTFLKVCQKIFSCKGKVIIMGMGKSGHIASKIASTFASTGTPSFFIHPSEAGHGDLGMITKKDIVILITYSGENDDILSIIPIIKKISVDIIAITGNSKSSIAKQANLCINVNIGKEACPNNLAPTSSSTATLVMGDALAISLLNLRNFSSNDFALYHPAGNLGKKLLTQVKDIMKTGDDLPLVYGDTSLIESLKIMSNKSLGVLIVIGKKDKILGIFTDGDLRRCIENNSDFHKKNISQLMQTNVKTIEENVSIYSAIDEMKKYKINALAVVDKYNKIVGAFNIHNLVEKKLI